MSTTYTIETAKGSHTGTLEQVWAWQEQMQGALPCIVTPSGERVDIDSCTSLEAVRAAIYAPGSETTAATVDHVAAECATEALSNGYEARHLSSQEDAMPGDYEALDEALGRHATVGERIDFRYAFSARLAQGRA